MSDVYGFRIIKYIWKTNKKYENWTPLSTSCSCTLYTIWISPYTESNHSNYPPLWVINVHLSPSSLPTIHPVCNKCLFHKSESQNLTFSIADRCRCSREMELKENIYGRRRYAKFQNNWSVEFGNDEKGEMPVGEGSFDTGVTVLESKLRDRISNWSVYIGCFVIKKWIKLVCF